MDQGCNGYKVLPAPRQPLYRPGPTGTRSPQRGIASSSLQQSREVARVIPDPLERLEHEGRAHGQANVV